MKWAMGVAEGMTTVLLFLGMIALSLMLIEVIVGIFGGWFA